MTRPPSPQGSLTDDLAVRANQTRRRNAGEVLRLLRDQGPLPRIQLAARLGLTPTSLTRITGQLIDLGLLRSLDPVPAHHAGRPRVPLDIAADRHLVVGVQVYGRLSYGLVDLRGRLVGDLTSSRLERPLSPEEAIGRAVEVRDSLTSGLPKGTRIIGIGLGSAGFAARGDTVVADDHRMGWDGVDMVDLVDRLGVTDLAVGGLYRSMAMAEHWFGAARGVDDFVQLSFGANLVSTIVVGGEPFDGAHGRAGAIGHIPISIPSHAPCTCEQTGCLTSVAGRTALLRDSAAAGLDIETLPDLFRLAATGHPTAERMARRRLDAVAEAVVLMINLFDPRKVVLSGASYEFPEGVVWVRDSVRPKVLPEIDVDEVVVRSSVDDAYTSYVIAAATRRLAGFYADPLAFAG